MDSGLIYLMRHGATPNDECAYPVLLGRKLDLGLSFAGQAHVKRMGIYLASKQIKAIYCSPQKRAVQTAYIILNILPICPPITFAASLKEADMGVWEGADPVLLARSDADRFYEHLQHPDKYGYPGGENFCQVQKRMVQFIRSLAAKCANKRILVISHKQAIRALLAYILALPLARIKEIEQDPGALNLIRVSQGTLSVGAINFTADLDLVDDATESVTVVDT